MSQYSLKTILSTFSNKNGKKLIILNASPIGGMSSTTIKLLLFSLPFLEYGILFNPYVLNILGLATSIVTYIVFMSIVIMIIVFTIYKVKKNTINKIAQPWKHYFNDVDLKLVLSSGITPYSKFFQYYSKIVQNEPTEEELYSDLLNSFKEMQEENSELIMAMEKANKNL